MNKEISFQEQKSKNILFLAPYPQGKAPSQRFRFEQYFDLLQKKGYTLHFQSFLDTRAWNNLYKDGAFIFKLRGVIQGILRRIAVLFKLKNKDFVFIHRECTPIGPPIFEYLIAKVFKKNIIYDFDDSIWLEDPNEKGTILSFLKFKSKVSKICKWSYKVSCGNSFLVNYALQFNKNVILNPTTIDTENVHVPLSDIKSNNPINIGWTGTHSTLHYLKSLIPVLKELKKEQMFNFIVIANRKPEFDIEFKHIPWSKESEIADLSKFDIGLMPLTEDKWSNGKCGFKALQYMALEIPPVVSPVGVNKSIIKNEENGFLCDNDLEWFATLKKLLKSNELRRKLGKNGRQSVINEFSVKSNSNNFISLFN